LFFVTNRIEANELTVEYCSTGETTGDFFTKPNQGALFLKFRNYILNLKHSDLSLYDPERSQECVGVHGNKSDNGKADDCQTVESTKNKRSPKKKSYADTL